jgi:hypothetical protein
MAQESRTHTIIAARPGWYVAVFVPREKTEDEQADQFDLTPIVAWEIERSERPYHPSAGRLGEKCIFHSVMPLTLDGNMDNWVVGWAVKTPDGKYNTPDFLADTEADALSYFRREYDAKDKERATSARTA